MMARDSHRLQVLAFYKHSQNIDFPCFVASAVMWTQVSCCFIRWVNIWYSLKWNPLRVIWRITNPGMKSPNLAVNLAGHFKRRAPRGRVEKELWSHMRMDQNLCTIGRMNLHKSMLLVCAVRIPLLLILKKIPHSFGTHDVKNTLWHVHQDTVVQNRPTFWPMFYCKMSTKLVILRFSIPSFQDKPRA